MNMGKLVLELFAYDDEQEWFELKENWFQPEVPGGYVSAFHYKPQAYFAWGVNDETYDIFGTTFNQYCDYNKEPYQNLRARHLSSSINFKSEETTTDD